MIDTVALLVPLEWDDPIAGGFIASYDGAGDLQYTSTKSLHLSGSHDAKVSVRTVERGWIEISGSFAKFLQGHNLFGSDDLPALARETLWRVMWQVGQAKTREEIAAAVAEAKVSRVDLTFMYELDTARDVSLWIERASELSSMKYRGRPTLVGSTLYFGKANKGKRASPWQLKIYDKGMEINVHKPSHYLPCYDELMAFAQGKLRVELTLRTQELKRIAERSDYRLCVRSCGGWSPATVAELFESYFARMELGDMSVVSSDLLEYLPVRLLGVYHVWLKGYSVVDRYPLTTAKRYRRQILDAVGVDIFKPAPDSNVVVFPLKPRVLRPNRVELPSWADQVLFRPVCAA